MAAWWVPVSCWLVSITVVPAICASSEPSENSPSALSVSSVLSAELSAEASVSCEVSSVSPEASWSSALSSWSEKPAASASSSDTALAAVSSSTPVCPSEVSSSRDSSFWSALSEVLSVLPHPESIPAVRAVANNTAKTLRFIFISPPYQIPKTPVPAFSGELFTLPL